MPDARPLPRPDVGPAAYRAAGLARVGLAAALGLYGTWVMWAARAWDVGFEPRLVLWAGLVLAAVVATVPGVRWRLRWGPMLVSVGVAASLLIAVEAPHAFEEHLFRREMTKVTEYVEAIRARTGHVPTAAEFDAGYVPRRLGDLLYRPSGESFLVHRSRTLAPDCMLGYDGARGTIWGTD